jgi:hypothetical protein
MEAKNFNFKEFFERKSSVEEQLQKELVEKSLALYELLPENLKKYFEEKLKDGEWLETVYNASTKGSTQGPYKTKLWNINDYGFSSKEELSQLFDLINESWKGLIEIQLIDEYPLVISYKMVLD